MVDRNEQIRNTLNEIERVFKALMMRVRMEMLNDEGGRRLIQSVESRVRVNTEYILLGGLVCVIPYLFQLLKILAYIAGRLLLWFMGQLLQRWPLILLSIPFRRQLLQGLVYLSKLPQQIIAAKLTEKTTNPSVETIQQLEHKRGLLYAALEKPAPPDFPALRVDLTVSRATLLEDCLRALKPLFGSPQLRHFRLSVSFEGEMGIDAGGLSRELFMELSRQLTSPKYNLFSLSESDGVTLLMKPLSVHSERVAPTPQGSALGRFLRAIPLVGRALPERQNLAVLYYRLCGTLVAKAVYDGQLLDSHFPAAFYKQLLGLELELTDLESMDPVFYKNLIGMMDYKVSEAMLELTFSVVEHDAACGSTVEVDLKPNGRHIEVDDVNKFEYIQRMAEYKLSTSTREQIDAFRSGFYDVIPRDVLRSVEFDESELELLICGLPDIDIRDWFDHTAYRGGYASVSPVIQWFWRAVKAMSAEERAKLLQFITGSSKVPPGGFANLRGSSGLQPFTIARADIGPTGANLPLSHTCFNRLDLPPYSSFEMLQQKLLIAITYGSTGFAIQ